MNKIMLRAYRQATNIRMALHPIGNGNNIRALRIISKMDKIRRYIDNRYKLGFIIVSKGA
jgi:hypothetical protein